MRGELIGAVVDDIAVASEHLETPPLPVGNRPNTIMSSFTATPASPNAYPLIQSTPNIGYNGSPTATPHRERLTTNTPSPLPHPTADPWIGMT